LPRHWSIGAWLMVIGVLLGGIGGVGPYLLGQTSQRSLFSALPLLISTSVVGAGGLIFVIGMVLYVVVPALDRNRARRNYGSHLTVLSSFVLAVLISIVLQLIFLLAFALTEPAGAGGGIIGGIAQGSRQMLGPLGLVAGIASLELSLLAILWVRIIRPGVITWSRMGLTGEHLGRRILLGLATGIVVFVVAAIVGLAMQRLGFEQTQMEMFEPIKGGSPIEFVLVLLTGGLLAGFAEEAFFRGYVFQAYWEQKGPWQAYLFSALVFGAVHLFSLDLRAFLPTFVAIFTIGLILAYVYNKTHSIVPTMIGHAINNSIAFAALYYAL